MERDALMESVQCQGDERERKNVQKTRQNQTNAGRQKCRNAEAEHEYKLQILTPPKTCACFPLACLQERGLGCISGREVTPMCEEPALGTCGKMMKQKKFYLGMGVYVCVRFKRSSCSPKEK